MTAEIVMTWKWMTQEQRDELVKMIAETGQIESVLKQMLEQMTDDEALAAIGRFLVERNKS